MGSFSKFDRFEGAWLRQQSYWYGEEERFTVDKPTDPAHGDKSEAPPPLMMDAPLSQGGGEVSSDAMFEVFETIPEATLIDETPVRGHGTPEESGHGFGGLTTPGATDAQLAYARGIDLGAPKDKTSDPSSYNLWHENYYTTRTVGFEPPPITGGAGDAILRRGLNAYPENDGDGGRPTSWSVQDDIDAMGGTWRRGEYEQNGVQRHFRPPNRRHGEVKMVENDIVTIIGDAPPPDKSDVYASPFSALAKFMPKRRRVMGIRRDPGPWDEDLTAQETPTTFAASVDGMVAQ